MNFHILGEKQSRNLTDKNKFYKGAFTFLNETVTLIKRHQDSMMHKICRKNINDYVVFLLCQICIKELQSLINYLRNIELEEPKRGNSNKNFRKYRKTSGPRKFTKSGYTALLEY